MTDSTRRATIACDVASPAVVAAAVQPDNTQEMTTTVQRPDGERDAVSDALTSDRAGVVHTVIEREETAGLETTADDLLVNVTVADAVAERARAYQNTL